MKKKKGLGTMPLVHRLRGEAKLDESFCIRLAVYMGFKTERTIHRWIKYGRLPMYHVQTVNKFLKENGNGNSKA